MGETDHALQRQLVMPCDKHADRIMVTAPTFWCGHALGALEYISRIGPNGTRQQFGIAYCGQACAKAMDPRDRQSGELVNLALLEEYEAELGW